MNTRNRELGDKVAELERAFNGMTAESVPQNPGGFAFRKPKGASVICGILAGTFMLATGWSLIEF